MISRFFNDFPLYHFTLKNLSITLPSTNVLSADMMSFGSEGAGVPSPTHRGEVSRRISSHSPASMKERRVAAPPSTMSDCFFLLYNVSSTSVMRWPLVSTMRSGDGPLHSRTSRRGCSRWSVTRPTRMASFSARILCTSMVVKGVEKRAA